MCECCGFREVASNNTKFCGSWLCRIMGRVERVGGCWLWKGARNKRTGYGKFQDRGRTILAHRASYQFFKGMIPDGLVVRHVEHSICGNKHCVNPNHLRLGTHKENTADRKTDGTDCCGRKHYKAYSAEFVIHCRSLVLYAGWTRMEVVRKYGIADSTLGQWIKGIQRSGNQVLEGEA